MLNFIKKNINHIIFLLLIVYSQYYSPVISDDWFYHKNFDYFIVDRPLSSFFIIKIHQLINYDAFFDNFKFFKATYLSLAYFFLYKFYSIFISKNYSQFFSFFAIFYPLHDSANFEIWFIGHLLCMILPLYSYYLFNKKYNYFAYTIFALSSFISYSALPTQISLICYKIIKKNYKRALILTSLFLVYIFYYLINFYVFEKGIQRIGVGFDKDSTNLIYEIISFQNIAIHIGSFLDVLIGPSHFIKVLFSIINNSLLSIIISLILTIFFFNILKYNNIFHKGFFFKALFIILVTLVSSQILFVISTKFINITFGLGNRVNIYISMLITLFIIWLTRFFNYKFLFILIFCFFLSFFGTTRYWESVNKEIIKLENDINYLSKKNTGQNIFLKNIEYVDFYNFKHIELLNFQNYLDWFIDSHNINLNNNYFYLLKDIDKETFRYNSNFIIYDFETSISKKLSNYNNLVFEYNNYNNYYNFRHWLQYFDLSKISFLLPNHYISKFIDLTKRD